MLTAPADERAATARSARHATPRSAHASWAPSAGRADPVAILTDQDAERLPWLVPVRHARMAESPFAFFRGGAAIMAADLATTPIMGVTTQLCGDAHLANFGSFASPERRQVFDVNDFDETMPGPWEWDVKRLAASMVVAARDNGLDGPEAGEAAQASVRGYQDAMRRFADTPVLDVWYAQVSLARLRDAIPSPARRRAFDQAAAKARTKNSQRALGKLTETVDGTRRFRRQPPLLTPLRDLAQHVDRDEVRAGIEENYRGYAGTLLPDRARLLSRFAVQDIALKVVGVGSVGTRCWLVLLRGRDHGEPLFLQIKEATASVLQAHLPTRTPQPGERVVTGRRLMQAASDVFLGWSGTADGRHYYWRQFHDMKASANVAAMDQARLRSYGELCGWTLAHAHARSGDAVAIAAYLGKGDGFQRAVTTFAVAYADQNEQDYEAFRQAIADGRIQAIEAEGP